MIYVTTQTNSLVANAGLTQTVNVDNPGGNLDLGGSSGSPPPTGFAPTSSPSSAAGIGFVIFLAAVGYFIWRKFL